MSNTKKIASAAFTGAAAAAATLMGGGPAFAAVSWYVRNGATGYTGIVAANLRLNTKASLVDKKTNKTLKCTNAAALGVITKSHSPGSSPVIGHLAHVTRQSKSPTRWSNCSVSSQKFKAHLLTSHLLQVVNIQRYVAFRAECLTGSGYS